MGEDASRHGNVMELGRDDGPGGKLLRAGAGVLDDRELLAVLLGPSARAAPAIALASTLLERAGGLKALAVQEPQELCVRLRLGRARTAQLLAAVELGRRVQRSDERRPRLRTPAEVYAYLAPRLGALRREVFHVLCFNTRNILLHDARVAEGSVASCPVDPREVFTPAVIARASAIVLAHNHPSGDPEPSAQDVSLTAQLARGGALLNIRVLDHLIVGDGTYVSMQERGQGLLCAAEGWGGRR